MALELPCWPNSNNAAQWFIEAPMRHIWLFDMFRKLEDAIRALKIYLSEWERDPFGAQGSGQVPGFQGCSVGPLVDPVKNGNYG